MLEKAFLYLMGTLRACLHTPFWIDPDCLPIKMLLQILLEEYVRFSITSNRAMVFSLAGDVSGIVFKGRFIEIRHFTERRLHLLNSLSTGYWRAAILSSISLKMPFARETVGFSFCEVSNKTPKSICNHFMCCLVRLTRER